MIKKGRGSDQMPPPLFLLADSILLPVLCLPGKLFPKIPEMLPMEFFHRKFPPISASNNVSRILDFDVALVWASFFSYY